MRKNTTPVLERLRAAYMVALFLCAIYSNSHNITGCSKCNIMRIYVEKLCSTVAVGFSWYKQWYIVCIESGYK